MGILEVFFDIEKLKKLDNESLVYLLGTDELIDIQFEVCRKNWVNFVNFSDFFNRDTVLKENDSRCVGWCDITDEYPFIEFFSAPKTRFLFKRKSVQKFNFLNLFSNRSINHRQAFLNMQLSVQKTGWTLFDLS